MVGFRARPGLVVCRSWRWSWAGTVSSRRPRVPRGMLSSSAAQLRRGGNGGTVLTGMDPCARLGCCPSSVKLSCLFFSPPNLWIINNKGYKEF